MANPSKTPASKNRSLELIKIRASQINGFVFCVQYHLNAARKLSVPPAKLDLVAVWRDARHFTAREKAALAWTEASQHREASATKAYKNSTEEFSQSELTFLTIAIINAWNQNREVVLAQRRRYHKIHFMSREKCTSISKFVLAVSDKFLIFTANGAT